MFVHLLSFLFVICSTEFLQISHHFESRLCVYVRDTHFDTVEKKKKKKKSRVITFYVYFSRAILCTNYAMSYDYSDPFIYVGLCKLVHMLGFPGSRVN